MVKKNSEHHEIVTQLKEQLMSKGFNPNLRFPKDEAMIAETGHYSIKPKIAHTAFKPDIIMSEN